MRVIRITYEIDRDIVRWLSQDEHEKVGTERVELVARYVVPADGNNETWSAMACALLAGAQLSSSGFRILTTEIEPERISALISPQYRL
jgi:hypothetical protein